LVNASVPPGVYEKIKFELHRFSTSEANQYANDATLKDFATADRYSILIEGITYKDGNPTLFNFKAQTTANLSLKFEPSLNLNVNTNNTIAIQLDPDFFFKKWESILDPADTKNLNDIENTIINTIKAIKK
jgi:phospholipase/lecithinase/hemolysin